MQEELVPHKVFTGDRPSLQLLLPELSPFTVGQLLSIYENRTVVSAPVALLSPYENRQPDDGPC